MRILLADDEPRVRYALRVVLERQTGLQIVGEATHTDELLPQTQETCPDLILLDWELPGLSDGAILASLRNTCPKLAVIALSGRAGARRAAVMAGADAFVSKSAPPEQLLAAIDACAPVQRPALSESSSRSFTPPENAKD